MIRTVKIPKKCITEINKIINRYHRELEKKFTISSFDKVISIIYSVYNSNNQELENLTIFLKGN